MSRSRLRRTLFGLALAAALAAGPAAGGEGLRAERLGAQNLELRPGGSDALGGHGDWALSNGWLCAVVADPGHETELSTRGGVLLDLGHCGRGDDQLVLLQPLLNLSQEGALPLEAVRAEVADGEARLVSVGETGGVRLEVVYALDGRAPERLRVRTRAERVGPGPRRYALAQVLLFGERSMRPFALVTGEPAASAGFVLPAFDPAARLSLLRAIGRADRFVLVGAQGLEPGIAYAHRLREAYLMRADGTRAELPLASVAGEGFAAIASFARPLWVGGGGDPGLLELLQTLFMDLEPGEALVQETELLVSGRADVASLEDGAGGAPLVSGRVDDATARVHLRRRDGGAASFVRPEADGRFALHLPAGDYRLRALAPGGRAAERELRVDGRPLELPALELGPPARLALPRGAPLRLVLRGADGTPDPVLRDDLLGFRLGEDAAWSSAMSRDVSLAGLPGDPPELVVPPGRYQVLATRGPEYAVAEARVEAAAGETRRLEIAPLPRAVESPGWMGADLHVHAAPSDDSSLPREARVASFLAMGAEVLVGTDHDHVGDYAPLLRELGLEAELASVVGVEISSSVRSRAVPHTSGHANAFPLPVAPAAYRGGAPRNEGLRLREIVAEVRGLGGERVVQLNHPRGETPGYRANQYFTHLGVAGEPFDPTRALGEPPNRVLLERDPASGMRDLDFDAIELMNGPSLERYRAVRADWFALLSQGEVRTATANSDTHHAFELAALPRTYVRLADDRPGAFDEAAFVRALREGRAFGSTGPLLEVRLGEAGIGERHRGREGRLRVEVGAAPWVPVGELRVFVDGELVEARPAAAGRPLELGLAFARDAFVTVEVEGRAEGAYAELFPGFTPFAFSNPIFVDADGDGAWTPPGLR